MRFLGWLRGRAGTTAKAESGSAPYDGASLTRRLRGWHAPTTSPNESLLPHLATLRDRSRAANRNDGYAKSIIEKDVRNIVGTGIKPMPLVEDEGLRQDLQELWLRWTDESDADGLLDFYGQQTQATRCWKEAGEAFVRLRPRMPSDGLSVPLQLQVLEPELCPHHHTETTRAGTVVRAGIEFDTIGRRIAYHFHPSRPDQYEDFDRSRLVRVPADAVVHLFDPLRAGQLRGMPNLTPTLLALYGVGRFADATLERQHLANLFVAFLTRPADAGPESVHPLTGTAAPPSDDGRPAISLKPGLFQELDPGEEVSFSDPPDIQGGYREFMRQQLIGACAGAGVPYEVATGDLNGLNDRVVRVILNEFRRKVRAEQHQIVAFQFCRRVWRAWVERVWMADVLPLPFEYVMNPAVKWVPEGWPYLNPVQDVQSASEAIRNGLTSRAAEVSARGEDVEVIDAEQAADNARADKLQLRYDSDGRQPTAKAGAAVGPKS